MARQRWLVGVLAISFALTACKSKKPDDAKPATASGSAAPVKADPAVAPKATAPAGDDLSLIPVEAEAVIGVNWAQVIASPVWKTFVEPEMMKDEDVVKGLADFKTRCGFDLMPAVKTMTVGLSRIGNDPPDGVMIWHGLDKAKTLACVDKWKDDLAKEQVTLEKDGEVLLLKNRDTNVAAMFISGDRLLLTIGTMATSDGIKKVAQGGSTLSTSTAFIDMHGKITKTDSAWFLMNGNSKIFEEAQSLGIRPKAVFGSINVTDGLTGDVRARLDSPDQATQTANNFRGQIQGMASMFDKLELTNDGADVKLSAAASAAKLKNLFKMLGGF